jgi:transcriptional regulator with XRE-family HTH domain
MSTENSQVFTKRLLSLRENRKKSDFARFLGIKSQVYQRYEEGRVPRHDILSVIAERCGVTVDWLLGRTEEKKEKFSESGMSGADRERYLAEVEAKGKPENNLFLAMILRRLEDLQIVPPAFHEKVRAELDDWINRYQTWCEANHPNVAALVKHKTEEKDKP